MTQSTDTTSLQEQIEEVMTRLEPKLKPLYKPGSFDVFNLKVAIENELRTIASKSAEVERKNTLEVISSIRRIADSLYKVQQKLENAEKH